MTSSLEALPRRTLGFLPTPLHALPHLTAALGGPRVFLKRDDLTGLAFGGNKVRKLEYLLGQALAEGCDAVITGGAAQSNHCRQTAAAAARSGLECHLALGGEPPASTEGNLLLDLLMDARPHWCGEHRKGEDVEDIAEQLRAQGRRPYVIPYGGSNPVGATGFVRAAFELHDQLDALSVSPTHVVLASSSAGSHAGLAVGAAMLEESYRLIGVEIDKEEADGVPLADRVAALADRTAHRVGAKLRFRPRDVHVWSGYTGEGYGVVGELEREAIGRVASTEGVLLDPVYTARAMGGLMDRIRRGELGRDDTVVFWHTGGQPALFAYAPTLIDAPDG